MPEPRGNITFILPQLSKLPMRTNFTFSRLLANIENILKSFSEYGLCTILVGPCVPRTWKLLPLGPPSQQQTDFSTPLRKPDQTHFSFTAWPGPSIKATAFQVCESISQFQNCWRIRNLKMWESQIVLPNACGQQVVWHGVCTVIRLSCDDLRPFGCSGWSRRQIALIPTNIFR